MQVINLVMLPGLDGTGLLFRSFIRALPASIKPVIVSYSTNTKQDYEELLAEVMRLIPKNEPFIILGESFGGPLAILIAASNPANLKAIILCASFLTCPQPLVPFWVSKFVINLPFRYAANIAKIAGYFGEYYSDELRKALLMVKPEVLAHRLKAVIKVNVTTKLAACDYPILLGFNCEVRHFED